MIILAFFALTTVILLASSGLAIPAFLAWVGFVVLGAVLKRKKIL